MKQRETPNESKLAKIREKIAQGLAEADRGELHGGEEIFSALQKALKKKRGLPTS